jgi:nitroreductase
MQLQKAIESRRSIRKYKKTKTPSWKTILECLDTVRYAPMSGNLFTINFILVDNQEAIQKIADASQQNFIAEAKYLVVFISNKERAEISYKDRAERYVKQQAGAAIQNFLLKLEEKGLSTCWIGLFEDEKIKSILSIPDKHDVEAIFPIGYAAEKPKKRSSDFRNLNAFLYFNKFGNKRMKERESVNV